MPAILILFLIITAHSEARKKFLRLSLTTTTATTTTAAAAMEESDIFDVFELILQFFVFLFPKKFLKCERERERTQ